MNQNLLLLPFALIYCLSCKSPYDRRDEIDINSINGGKITLFGNDAGNSFKLDSTNLVDFISEWEDADPIGLSKYKARFILELEMKDSSSRRFRIINDIIKEEKDYSYQLKNKYFFTDLFQNLAFQSTEVEYVLKSKSSLEKMIENPCENLNRYEIIDLYSDIFEIPNDSAEKIVLVDALKRKGFKVSNWGRGNWKSGPRIISMELESPSCECQVDKLYRSRENNSSYIVSERIKCRKLSR